MIKVEKGVAWVVDNTGASRTATLGECAEHIERLRNALADAYPFVCVSVDRWRESFNAKELHPQHAEIADRIAVLVGAERMPSKVLVGR